MPCESFIPFVVTRRTALIWQATWSPMLKSTSKKKTRFHGWAGLVVVQSCSLQKPDGTDRQECHSFLPAGIPLTWVDKEDISDISDPCWPEGEERPIWLDRGVGQTCQWLQSVFHNDNRVNANSPRLFTLSVFTPNSSLVLGHESSTKTARVWARD